MKTNIYIFVMLLWLLGIGQAWGGTAKLTVKVCTSSASMGQVLATKAEDVSSSASWKTDNSTVSQSFFLQAGSVTWFAHAKAIDDNHIFLGWALEDNAEATIVSTSATYKVTISYGRLSDGEKTVYAIFAKKTDAIISFDIPQNGSYTASVGATAIDTNTSYNINTPTDITLKAKANTGYKFLGWYELGTDGAKNYFSFDITTTKRFSTSVTIGASFISEDGDKPIFIVEGDNNTFYRDLNTANTAADASTSKTIVLVGNGVMPEGNYSISSGNILLIPSDAKHTCKNTNVGPEAIASYTTPSAYKTLTLAEGVNIELQGSLCVNAKMASNMGYNGAVTGPYGYIKMTEGSFVSVKSGGNLYCWGFISGDGRINAESGAKVFENFQMTDFRGGNATYSMNGNSKQVFPFNQYYIQNIEAPLRINYGAEEHVFSYVSTSEGEASTGDIVFIGRDDQTALFKLQSTNGYIEKYYDGATDRQIYDLKGNASLGELKLIIKVPIIGSITVSSSKYVLPLTDNLSITIKNGKLTTGYDLEILPSTEFTIDEDSEFVIASGKKIFVYDEVDWRNADGTVSGYTYPTSSSSVNLGVKYSPTKKITRKVTDFVDAKLNVLGTLTVNGSLYTTSGGADICCTQGNGKAKFTNQAPSDDNTYQVKQSGTDVSYEPILVNPAKLHNADGSYTETAGASAGATYRYADGKWNCAFALRGNFTSDNWDEIYLTPDGNNKYHAIVKTDSWVNRDGNSYKFQFFNGTNGSYLADGNTHDYTSNYKEQYNLSNNGSDMTWKHNTEFSAYSISAELKGTEWQISVLGIRPSYENIAFQGEFPNSIYELNKVGDNKFSGIINASSWSAQAYNFKLYNKDKNVTWGSDQGVDFSESRTCAFREGYDWDYLTWTHNTDYPSYYATAEYKSGEDGSYYWDVKITGVTDGYYLPGSWNEWDITDEDYKFVDNTLTLTLEENKEYKFKFFNANGAHWSGNSGTIENSTETPWKFSENVDCILKTTSAGDYVFTLSWDGIAPCIMVKYPESYEAQTLTLAANKTIEVDGQNKTYYYATFSNDDYVTFFPESVEDEYTAIVETVDIENKDNQNYLVIGALETQTETIDGKEITGFYVPAGAGVLIKVDFSKTEKTIPYYIVKGHNVDALQNNLLRPASQTMEASGYKFYKLAYKTWTGNAATSTGLGFWWGAENGAAFKCKAGTAYLAISASTSAKGFAFDEDETTGICSIEIDKESDCIYNVAGQRISQPVRGQIYIMNGRKYIAK